MPFFFCTLHKQPSSSGVNPNIRSYPPFREPAFPEGASVRRGWFRMHPNHAVLLKTVYMQSGYFSVSP